MDMTLEHLRAVLRFCVLNKTCGTKKQEIWCLQNGYVHKNRNGMLELTRRGLQTIGIDPDGIDVT